MAPVVVLVGPQLGENVGTAARAMLNCGLRDLRIVAPRDGWPSEKAQAAASGATVVLDSARLFDSVEEAVADLSRIYATSARARDMVKPVVTPSRAAEEIRGLAAEGTRCGLLFGRERIGLTNEEVTLADSLLTVPLNPGFSSLNLAQAVLLIGHAWYALGDDTPEHQPAAEGRSVAERKHLFGFFEHLEGALDPTGFFKTEQLRPTMVQALRNLFVRAELTAREVRTLHGVVTALGGRRKDQL